MSADRDTHFANFAKLLWQELLYVEGGYIDAEDFSHHGQNHYPVYEKVIAQRAYDLVQHALDKANTGYMICPENDIADVPDLTEWPA